jgi:PAS domain S-box-containing protein
MSTMPTAPDMPKVPRAPSPPTPDERDATSREDGRPGPATAPNRDQDRTDLPEPSGVNQPSDELPAIRRVFGVVAVAGLAGLLVFAMARRWPIVLVAAGLVAVIAGLGVFTYRVVERQAKARRDAVEGAAASVNQLQKLIDNTCAVIYMKRIDNGQYLLVNREWERLFGVTRDRVVNLTDRDVFPPSVAEQLRANDLGVALAGRTVQYEESAESDDELRTYVSVKFPVLDSGANPYAVCGISTDITDRKRAEEEVRRLNADLETRVWERTAELEASTKELDAFAYSVSHDLRAPLRSLHGFSDALLDDYSDVLDEEGLDYLRRIQRNVERMDQMIDDLLNLSRATRVELMREVVDLSGIARDIMAELVAASPERVVRTLIHNGLRAYGDPQLIRLALHNLLANAWKFTGKHADAVIEVGRTVRDGEEVFFVRDNGAGFDMQYKEKLFSAFQRLHPVAEFEGTGIGLATVARVVRRHGGRIFANAEVGIGATFYFSFSGTGRHATTPRDTAQPEPTRDEARTV